MNVSDLKNKIQSPIFLYDFTVTFGCSNGVINDDLLSLIIDIDVPILNFASSNIKAGVFYFPVFSGYDSKVLTLNVSFIEDSKFTVLNWIKKYRKLVANDDGTFNEPVNYVFDIFVRFGSNRGSTNEALKNNIGLGGVNLASNISFLKKNLSSKLVSGNGFLFKNVFVIIPDMLKFSHQKNEILIYKFNFLADRMDLLE